MILFNREYDDENLVDLQEDLFSEINRLVSEGSLEQDEEGFITGKYIVQVVYKNDN